jgi:hypothetical protein
VIHALTFATYAITLDGRTVLPRARTAVREGHILVPVRALGDALGADVGYDGPTRTITVQRGAHFATLRVPKDAIVKGTAYAPLRQAATVFGLHVGYDPATRTVALDEPRPPAPVARAPRPVPPPATTNPATYAVTLTPPSGAEVHDPYPAISARFAGAASIDPRSLRVLLDGRDVSAEAAVIGDQVLLTPRSALAPGSHSVSVSGRDASGAPIERQWSFVDNFAFVVAPPPTPYPISAIWIDRWVTPGTTAFDVYVHGAPGITGYVGVDGVSSYFPLRVYTANSYVAHVIVPDGVNQPFARVAARLTLPDGTLQTIVLPQTITLVTPAQQNLGPNGPRYPSYPSPVPSPTRRSVNVPTPSPTPSPRSYPQRTPLPAPTATPTTAVQNRTPPPGPAGSPSPRPSRRPIIRRTASPSPTPG